MGIWKDKARKDWAYSFQYRGNRYGSRGFKTRREASAAFDFITFFTRIFVTARFYYYRISTAKKGNLTDNR